MFVFRNYTIENLFPEDSRFSGYDDISFIPSDEKELVWLYQVPIGFDMDAKIASVDAMINKFDYIVSALRPAQTLVVCSLMDMFTVDIVDSDSRLKDAIYAFNKHAAQTALSNNAVKFLDISEYFRKFPVTDWINWRFYFISQMIVSPNLASGFKKWFALRTSQLNGQRKKCLVLDLDNTLWGGVLGEDGINGIKVGGDYPGNAFLYFQQSLIELSKSGVILAVCSKNNEADVLEAWQKNPFIKLNNKYISAYRINWNNKADNIRELASELNIGLDSMVFIDDNPTERELVRQELPMVSVPDFPQKPYGLMNMYEKIVEDYFRAYELTSEDRKKTEQYRANAERANASRQFTNMTDFIRSLKIHIEISPADNFNIARIAQMTQKTNQFNLTTHRYTESDINNFIANNAKIFCISVSDKFGDNGITGEIICRIKDQTAYIDTLLLSCRILGKGIEDVFFKTIMNILYAEGVKYVEAQYIPTAKNSQVSTFYDRQGMTLLSDTAGTKTYRFELNGVFEVPDYYDISIK